MFLAPAERGHARVIAMRADGDVALLLALGKMRQGFLGGRGGLKVVRWPDTEHIINPHLFVLNL